MVKNILSCKNANEFRTWLINNVDKETECYLILKRGKPTDNNVFYYLDAVEQALCFGFIDCTLTKIDGIFYQKFTPRSKNSHWTELNKERVRRLEKLGLMTDYGRRVLPDMSFTPDIDIINALKLHNVWQNFSKMPPLYKRVKLSNLAFYKSRFPDAYNKMLQNLIKNTKQNKLYGEWNDYGRLLDY